MNMFNYRFIRDHTRHKMMEEVSTVSMASAMVLFIINTSPHTMGGSSSLGFDSPKTLDNFPAMGILPVLKIV